MNAFHVCGIIFVVWALTVAVLGITREGFPASDGATRAVCAISVLLALTAIGTGIYTAATEEEAEEEQALVLRV